MERNKKILGHVYALFSVIVWGSCYVLTKNLLNAGFTPLQITPIRMALAYVALLLMRPKFQKLPLRDELIFVLIGGTAFFLFTYFLNGISSMEKLNLGHLGTGTGSLVSTEARTDPEDTVDQEIQDALAELTQTLSENMNQTAGTDTPSQADQPAMAESQTTETAAQAEKAVVKPLCKAVSAWIEQTLKERK